MEKNACGYVSDILINWFFVVFMHGFIYFGSKAEHILDIASNYFQKILSLGIVINICSLATSASPIKSEDNFNLSKVKK